MATAYNKLVNEVVELEHRIGTGVIYAELREHGYKMLLQLHQEKSPEYIEELLAPFRLRADKVDRGLVTRSEL